VTARKTPVSTKDAEEQIRGIITALEELEEDNTVPRNIKTRIHRIIETLNEKGEFSIRIDKALQELDEISDDTNLQPYTRTQIWQIASMLEKV